MSYLPFLAAGDRLAVAICPCAGGRLAVAVADPHGHPFDLDPAILDRRTAERLRDPLSAWLEATPPPRMHPRSVGGAR